MNRLALRLLRRPFIALPGYVHSAPTGLETTWTMMLVIASAGPGVLAAGPWPREPAVALPYWLDVCRGPGWGEVVRRVRRPHPWRRPGTRGVARECGGPRGLHGGAHRLLGVGDTDAGLGQPFGWAVELGVERGTVTVYPSRLGT